MGSTRNGHSDPKCPSTRHLRMVREDTGAPNEGLPVPGWWPMKQLAVRVRFLRYVGFLNDCSVEGVLSLVFVQIISLGSTGPNTSSQHNQSGPTEELLA
ncbi:hypothetical protein TNCV_4046491 [Trichonephila clavipes]|nr:hypothetical protein TNCV_4046491 [Trichonephila clavipes]